LTQATNKNMKKLKFKITLLVYLCFFNTTTIAQGWETAVDNPTIGSISYMAILPGYSISHPNGGVITQMEKFFGNRL